MSDQGITYNTILQQHTPGSFNALALEIFYLQYKKNAIYRRFADYLGVVPDKVTSPELIPFLPVEFFRKHQVVCGDGKPEGLVFESSGTTGTTPSRHYVKDPSLYEESYTRAFGHFYGKPSDFHFLALLPSYMERSGSSLIYMIDHFIRMSGPGSGYFLDDHETLVKTLKESGENGKKLILWGVSYALLDLVEKHSLKIPNVIVIETGGMKGRRKELTREELHRILCKGFGVSSIHSEYGMTELLSQAYSSGAGRFYTPPWMKVMIREINDPFAYTPAEKTGGINIIDLANIHSCSFIATQDLGRMHDDGSFEVLGRFDSSDVRGCNLMVV